MPFLPRALPVFTLIACCSLAACQGTQAPAPSADEPPRVADATPAPGPTVQPADGVEHAPPAQPFRAVGQEPSWLLRINAGQAELITDFGQRSVTLPLTGTEHDGPVTRFTAADAAHRLAATVTRGVCRDTMSGMPHPFSVSVVMDGTQMNGCGGEPISLLTDRNWVVEDLDGGGIIDRSRITLAFSGEDGRLYGLASCNRFMAGFSLSGEGLSISQAAATMMACAESLMIQEQKFLNILGAVNSFNIDDTGALLLSGPGGTLKAYPETTPAD
jgi:heat shock protein HslJ